MSKQGVALTQEHRKPRKRVRLEEREIDGVMVVGKECTMCGEWKTLDDFSHKKGSLGGRRAMCKNPCSTEYFRNYREVNHDKVLEYARDYYEEHREERAEYYKNNREKRLQYDAKYRRENRAKVAERHRLYRNTNREKTVKILAKWRDANPEYMHKYYRHNKQRFRLYEHRRRARNSSLPSNLTNVEYTKTLTYFNGICALSKNSGSLEKEHAIPISIGHGGTTFGNCYPMANGFNQSKGNSNMFEWFEANRQRFELSQENFDRLVDYLAVVNGLTTQEYRDFYYWCFANPRTVDEVKADQRHSIEIWREAVGKQFPLPTFTATYNSTDNESEAG